MQRHALDSDIRLFGRGMFIGRKGKVFFRKKHEIFEMFYKF